MKLGEEGGRGSTTAGKAAPANSAITISDDSISRMVDDIFTSEIKRNNLSVTLMSFTSKDYNLWFLIKLRAFTEETKLLIVKINFLISQTKAYSAKIPRTQVNRCIFGKLEDVPVWEVQHSRAFKKYPQLRLNWDEFFQFLFHFTSS